MLEINLLKWQISFTCRKDMAKYLNLQVFCWQFSTKFFNSMSNC